jgi:hypothetical protein
MRWAILILNILAIVALQFFAGVATAAHRTHAYSVYRGLVADRALVEQPTDANGKPVDVEARLRTIGSGGYYSTLANIGSVACLLSGVVFFFAYKPPRNENAA